MIWGQLWSRSLEGCDQESKPLPLTAEAHACTRLGTDEGRTQGSGSFAIPLILCHTCALTLAWDLAQKLSKALVCPWLQALCGLGFANSRCSQRSPFFLVLTAGNPVEYLFCKMLAFDPLLTSFALTSTDTSDTSLADTSKNFNFESKIVLTQNTAVCGRMWNNDLATFYRQKLFWTCLSSISFVLLKFLTYLTFHLGLRLTPKRIVYSSNTCATSWSGYTTEKTSGMVANDFLLYLLL